MKTTSTTRKPNAFIVGPMKAGTSWLHEYLRTRDDVVVPSRTKETFYFDRHFNSKRAAWYYRHFQANDWSNVVRTIEVAPTYFAHPEVPSRIAATLGQIKIVVTLRDPAERAFSLYQHMRRYGLTNATSFRDCVRQHDKVVSSSRYFESIQRWTRLFGSSSVTTLFMDDLVSAPLEFCASCCQGLGLAPPSTSSDLPQRVNAAANARHYQIARLGRVSGDLLRSYHLHSVIGVAKRIGMKRLFFGSPQRRRVKLSQPDREWFIRIIESDLRSLAQFVDRDLSPWLQPNSLLEKPRRITDSPRGVVA